MGPLLKLLKFIVTGPEVNLPPYRKPELLRSFQDSCGNWHHIYKGGVSRDYTQAGWTPEGNKSRVVTALGNNTWDVHTEDWNTQFPKKR